MPDEGERVQKILARAGFGSRRACELLIADGRVTIDGVVAQLGARAQPDSHIAVDGVPVLVDAALVHLLLNKPAGYVSTARDPQGRPTVLDLVPDNRRLFSVGRLDLDSEGLLILTNDGELAQLLMHPRHGVAKEYFVEVEGVPDSAALRRLRDGVELDDGVTQPAEVRVVQQSAHGTTALEITVKEGRKRMVRRMCAAVRHPVVRLVRTRIGPLRDGKLAPGAWRALTSDEVRALYAAALANAEGESEADG
ncbi:MAG TPA: pseudouridine synthase [Acidimicrobiia bacterium]|nr:pseudouridine synthase [Acidimicrobiia bacterium]